MKKLALLVLALLVVAGMAGAGTFAYFSDTEASTGNTFTAGTLDLKVDDRDNPNVVSVTLSDMKPGDGTVYYKWVLKNTGTLPGRVSVTFSPITNDDNGLTESESACDTTGGAGEGELGQYLKPGIHPDNIPDDVKPYVTILERNDEEGWYIATVDGEMDTGGTIGWGPKGWSCPSNLYSIWSTGPPNSWGVPGLNGMGGKTYGTFGHLSGDVLNPGQEVAFFFRVRLDDNLRIWNGCSWVEVDDNIIQGDSVSFNLTFKLDQI
jgi:predicted ribosomally synthesized peptide with SipW-like signal peptide